MCSSDLVHRRGHDRNREHIAVHVICDQQDVLVGVLVGGDHLVLNRRRVVHGVDRDHHRRHVGIRAQGHAGLPEGRHDLVGEAVGAVVIGCRSIVQVRRCAGENAMQWGADHAEGRGGDGAGQRGGPRGRSGSRPGGPGWSTIPRAARRKRCRPIN